MDEKTLIEFKKALIETFQDEVPKKVESILNMEKEINYLRDKIVNEKFPLVLGNKNDKTKFENVFFELFDKAYWLYVDGHFYSCVSIIRTILEAYLREKLNEEKELGFACLISLGKTKGILSAEEAKEIRKIKKITNSFVHGNFNKIIKSEKGRGNVMNLNPSKEITEEQRKAIEDYYWYKTSEELNSFNFLKMTFEIIKR